MKRALVGGAAAAAMVAAAIGLAMPAAAAPSDSGTGTINVTVENEIGITVTDAVVSLAAAAGGNADSPDSQLAYTVRTNNTAGYSVDVQAGQAALLPANTGTNPDSIPVGNITVADTSTSAAGDGASGKLSASTPVTVYTQDVRSSASGDKLTAGFSADIPFVNADKYSGTVTITANAN